MTLQNKIGKDVTRNSQQAFLTFTFNSGAELYKNKILEVLSNKPKTTNEVSKTTGISWITCKSLLLELLTEGKIIGFKSNRNYFFQLKPQEKCSVAKCSENAVGSFKLVGFSKEYALCSKHLEKAREKGLLVEVK